MKKQVRNLVVGDKVKFITGMGVVKSVSVPVKMPTHPTKIVCIVEIELNGTCRNYRWGYNTTITVH